MHGKAPADVAAVLLPLVYEELRAVAQGYLKRERGNHTLQTTALVHEAFLRLINQSRVDWQGRSHFLAVGAEAMRRILVDHARGRGRAKRGQGWHRVTIENIVAPGASTEIDLISLADALEKLQALDADQARVVQLRIFTGLTVAEVAEVMGCSKRKVEGLWTHAKAWVRAELALEPQA
jgi:RNA polymerase sigma factor (TIGR02999 family)